MQDHQHIKLRRWSSYFNTGDRKWRLSESQLVYKIKDRLKYCLKIVFIWEALILINIKASYFKKDQS